MVFMEMLPMDQPLVEVMISTLLIMLIIQRILHISTLDTVITVMESMLVELMKLIEHLQDLKLVIIMLRSPSGKCSNWNLFDRGD